MTDAGLAFAPDAYVVRYGRRTVLRAAGCLLGGLAIIIAVIVARRSITAVVIGLIIAGVLIDLAVMDMRKAARGEVAFAVDKGGVYFGSESVKENVPWSRIRAVEFFTETETTIRSRTRHRCVGVRSRGDRQTMRPGNGAAAWPIPPRSVQYLIDAGRPDLIPGADGTIRYAYRRMTGWRVDQALVAAAVARYAPGLPVVDGPNYPPPISSAAASQAHRNRRAAGL